MSRHIAPATAAANAAAFSSVSESMRFSQVSTVPHSAPSNASHYAYPDPNTPEPDDWLHNPDPVKDRSGSGAFRDSTGSLFTLRGLMNMGVLILLALGLLMLFGGYPILDHFLKRPESTKGGECDACLARVPQATADLSLNSQASTLVELTLLVRCLAECAA